MSAYCIEESSRIVPTELHASSAPKPRPYLISFSGYREDEEDLAHSPPRDEKLMGAATTGNSVSCHRHNSRRTDYASLVDSIKATLLPSITRKTNIVVCWRGLTHKRITADTVGIPVVTPMWLEDAAARSSASSSLPDPSHYHVPLLYGYVFSTSGLSPEEVAALSAVVRQHGGTMQEILNQRCDALFVSPERASLIRRSARRGGFSSWASGNIAHIEESGNLISAKVHFAWQLDIPVVSYQRFLQLAALDSKHSNNNKGEAASQQQVDFDAVVDVCRIPPVATAEVGSTTHIDENNNTNNSKGGTEYDDNFSEDDEEGDIHISEGSRSEFEDDIADELESAFESNFFHKNNRAVALPESINEAACEPPSTLPVASADYYSCPMDSTSDGAMTEAMLIRDYYQKNKLSDSALSLVKAKLLPSSNTLEGEDQYSVMPQDEQSKGHSSDAAVRPNSFERGTTVNATSLAPLPNLWLLQNPPVLSVCIIGCSDKELQEAVMACHRCRFSRTPVPTRATDIVVLGRGAVKLKKMKRDAAAAASKRHQQLRDAPASEKPRLYYECDADLMRQLQHHYGIGANQLVPMSWLKACQRAMDSLAAAASATHRASDFLNTLLPETGEASMALSVPSQTLRAAEAIFSPDMALSVESLPPVHDRRYRVIPRRWTSFSDHADGNNSIPAAVNVAPTIAALPSGTIGPTNSTVSTKGAANSNTKEVATIPPAGPMTNSIPKRISEGPFVSNEVDEYTREREKATTMLDALLQILQSQPTHTSAAVKENAMRFDSQTLPMTISTDDSTTRNTVFSNCIMCFVDGEFNRTDLAVVRGLVRLGSGTSVKKTLAQWRASLAKKRSDESAASASTSSADKHHVECVRRHTIFGKKKHQLLGGIMSSFSPVIAEKTSDISNNLMSLVMPSESSMTVTFDELRHGSSHHHKIAGLAAGCKTHPTFRVVAHYYQQPPKSSAQQGKTSTAEELSGKAKNPLRYVINITIDYILSCLATGRLLDPRSCFIFTQAISSSADMLLRRHALRRDISCNNTKLDEQSNSTTALTGAATPCPPLSRWLWQKRYAKSGSVGVCVSFLWRLPRTTSNTPGYASSSSDEEGSQNAMMLGTGCDSTPSGSIPDPKLAPLLRTLLLGLHHVVQVLGGTIRDQYDPDAVTHVVVVDVHGMCNSSISAQYNGVDETTDAASSSLPKGEAVLWPQADRDAAQLHAATDDVSIVSLKWLEDSLQWGVFVSEDAESSYGCPWIASPPEEDLKVPSEVVTTLSIGVKHNSHSNYVSPIPIRSKAATTPHRTGAVSINEVFDFGTPPAATPLKRCITEPRAPSHLTHSIARAESIRSNHRMPQNTPVGGKRTSPFRLRNSVLRASSRRAPSGPTPHAEGENAEGYSNVHADVLGTPTTTPILHRQLDQRKGDDQVSFIREGSDEVTRILAEDATTPHRHPVAECDPACHSTPVAVAGPGSVQALRESMTKKRSRPPSPVSQDEECKLPDGSSSSQPSSQRARGEADEAVSYFPIVDKLDRAPVVVSLLTPWDPSVQSSSSVKPMSATPNECSRMSANDMIGMGEATQLGADDDTTSQTALAGADTTVVAESATDNRQQRFSHELLDSPNCEKAVLVPASFVGGTPQGEHQGCSGEDGYIAAPEVRRTLLLAGEDSELTCPDAGVMQKNNSDNRNALLCEEQHLDKPLVKHQAAFAASDENADCGDTSQRTDTELCEDAGRVMSEPRRAAKRPRLTYTSISPPPRREDAMVIQDDTFTPFKRHSLCLAHESVLRSSGGAARMHRGLPRNINLASRTTPTPPPPPALPSPAKAVKATKTTDGAPLRVYVFHDLPDRVGLLARYNEAVRNLPPTLARSADRVEGRGEDDADYYLPFTFCDRCEVADCVVAHDLSPRESVLVAIAAGLWVVRPSFLPHIVDKFEKERAPSEWWGGSASPQMHRLLELHEWTQDMLPNEAPPLQLELARQCSLRRKQRQQLGCRVFDGKLFVLCFPGSPKRTTEVSLPSCVKLADATSPTVPERSSHSLMQCTPQKNQGSNSDAAIFSTPRPDQHPRVIQANRKIDAILRLVRAGGGIIGDVLQLHDCGDSYLSAFTSRLLQTPRGSLDLSQDKRCDVGAEPMESDAVLEDMAKVLCAVLLAAPKQSELPASSSELQEVVVLFEASILATPIHNTSVTASSDQPTLRAWLHEMLLASSQAGFKRREMLRRCLHRAHQETEKIDCNDNNINNKDDGSAFSLAYPVLPLVASNEASGAEQAADRFTERILQLVKERLSLNTGSTRRLNTHSVHRVSMRTMSWLARHISGQKDLELDSSTCFGTIDIF